MCDCAHKDESKLLEALLVIADFPYPGAPDIAMRKIARQAIDEHTAKTGEL